MIHADGHSNFFLSKLMGKMVMSLKFSEPLFSRTITYITDFMRNFLWENKTNENNRNINWSIQKQPPEVFCKKGVIRNFAKFKGKHLCQRPFFKKVAGLRPATLLKESLWHRCFPLNFAKILRTAFLQNTSGRLFCLLGM